MRKVPKAIDAPAVCCLAIYLEQQLGSDGCRWSIHVERPGRDGEFSRTWLNASGAIQADQLDDMSGYVARTVNDALVLWGGVPEVRTT